MPKELHDRLAKLAKRKNLHGDRFRAYVYGTMKRIEKNQKAKANK